MEARYKDVKDEPRTDRPVIENIDKITEIAEVDRLVDPFLKRIMTGDEKWVKNYNIVRNPSWLKRSEAAETVAKPGLTARKLKRLKLATDQKWPEFANRRGVVFRQDNARPHISVMIRQNLWKLGWEGLMHSLYSPDLAPLSLIAKLPE
ncbi:HTH_48 domain-containing protein [Trichonephila clavipes]|nr:HTH_48 domain-containing protein [Trichonephila clavipes]